MKKVKGTACHQQSNGRLNDTTRSLYRDFYLMSVTTSSRALICTATYICVQLPNTLINEQYPFYDDTSRHPADPATIEVPPPLPAGNYKATGAQIQDTQLLDKLTTTKSKVSAILQEQQRPYYRNFDSKVRFLSKFPAKTARIGG